MADTVKARAKRYARGIERRKLERQGRPIGRKEALEIEHRAKVTPSLLALARINLGREARREAVI